MTTKSLTEHHPLEPSKQAFESIPAPREVCELHLMRMGTLDIPGFLFVQGLNRTLTIPSYCFMIVHNGDPYMFDLGMRIDLNYDDRTSALCTGWCATAPSSPALLLPKSDIPLHSVKEIFLSHEHFDHIGDLTEWPTSITLVLGPHTDASMVTDHDKLSHSMQVSADVLKARKVMHLADRPESDWVIVGSLRGLDYFGDGSFYILDTPGHMDGHIGALVCISSSPKPLYHLLAGDAAHVISLINYEQPAHIGVYKAMDNAFSPYHTSEPEKLGCFEEDIEIAYATMAKLARMDHEENINVILAHDHTIDSIVAKNKSFEGLLRLDGSNFCEVKSRGTIV